MSDTDLQLLSRYNRLQAEDAFAELVRRHVDLVHSAALRQVRSPQLAEEVAQSVFIDLARQARLLAPETILSAWLYEVTRRTAIDVVRREARRQLREQIATEMNAMNATAADWTHIEPLLDEAMHALDETDRAAVLLRYFENKSLREVGAALGTSDDAAQKRVSRAVERLREFLAKRGVTVGASGLVVIISTNAVLVAPAGLSAALAATALAGTTIAAAATAIAMTTLQKTLIAASLAAAIGTGIYEARQASDLREQNQTLRQLTAEEIQRLQQERNEVARKLAALQAENESLNRNTTELVKLRSEVTNLRNQAPQLAQGKTAEANDPMAMMAKAWLGRVKLLKQRFEQWPGKKTPELELLAEQDWLEEVAHRELDSDVACREAMSRLRYVAKSRLAQAVNDALEQFAKSNNDQLPTELSQLTPYLKPPADSCLEGYQITKPGWVDPPQPSSPNSERAKIWALVEKGSFTSDGIPIRDGSNLADADYDQYVVIYRGHGGYYGYGVTKTKRAN